MGYVCDLNIRYAEEDKSWAESLRSHLQAFGISVTCVRIDALGPQSTAESDISIALLCSHNMLKAWEEPRTQSFREELYELFIEKGNTPGIFVCLRVDQTVDSTLLPTLLRDLRYIDLSDDAYSAGIKEILQHMGLRQPTFFRNPIDQSELVLVEGGIYSWGDDTGASPRQVPSFYLAKRVVTCGQFWHFADGLSDRRQISNSFVKFLLKATMLAESRARQKEENGPARYVDNFGATAYAAWTGTRLPTAFELEYVVLANDVGRKAGVEDIGTRRWEWTSTPGHEFTSGASLGKFVGMTSGFKMSRNFQVHFDSKFYCADLVFRCASDIGSVFSPIFAVDGKSTIDS